MSEHYTTPSEISDLFSMEKLQQNAIHLNHLERNSSYSDFEASNKYCMDVLQDAGFSNIERISHPADGKTSAFDCVMPQAWDLQKRSFLKIISPKISEDDAILADSSENPVAAIIWSAPTPAGGIDTELIDVSSIDEKMDVGGKIIFSSQKSKIPGSLFRKLAERGVAGLAVSDFAASEKCPEDLFWFNGWGQFGWYLQKEALKLPIFSLSPRRARQLLDRLETGERVFVHAEMNTRIYDGETYTITATIPGESEEEYALFSHMYEPFLGDNTTGFAIGVEIGRLAKTLLKNRQNRLFKKTLRVVFSMEQYGFAAFLADCNRSKKITAALSLDGFSHLCSQKLELRLSPMTTPFFGDLYYSQIFKKIIPEADWSENPATLSDDTFGGDPMIGIPTNWLYNASGIFHHNTGLFFKPDWLNIKQRFPVLATAVINLLNPVGADFEKCAKLMAETAIDELKTVFKKIAQRFKRNKLKKDKALTWCVAWYDYEYGRMKSLEHFAPDALKNIDWKTPLLDALKEIKKDLAEIEPPKEESPACLEASHLIVKRLCAGAPFSLAKIPYQEKNNFGFSNPKLLFSYFNGKRSLKEAFDLVECALDSTETTEKEMDDCIKYLSYLEKYDYLKLEKK